MVKNRMWYPVATLRTVYTQTSDSLPVVIVLLTFSTARKKLDLITKCTDSSVTGVIIIIINRQQYLLKCDKMNTHKISCSPLSLYKVCWLAPPAPTSHSTLNNSQSSWPGSPSAAGQTGPQCPSSWRCLREMLGPDVASEDSPKNSQDWKCSLFSLLGVWCSLKQNNEIGKHMTHSVFYSKNTWWL